jgi:hypothetical protein
MKKSFILYIDSLNILGDLNTQQAGELFIAIYNYHLSGETPTEFWLKIALTPFINQWERDLEKWERIAEIRKENGRKGGLSKSKQMLANAIFDKQELANVAVNGNVNVNVNGNVTGKVTKEKKSIQKKFETPTLEDVQKWFVEQGSTAEQGAKAWQYYTDGNWHDAKGQPVKNWRQKMRGGRWLETLAQTKQNEGQQYQNLTHESNYQNLTEFNDFFTSE